MKLFEPREIEFDEILDASDIYNQAIVYADSVGMIDWPFPFPEELIEDYFDKHEMFCVQADDSEQDIIAVFRLSETPNRNIWPDEARALYIGKAAVGHKARSLDLGENTILPFAEKAARSRDLDELRIDCLGSNQRLRSFYQKGFVEQGDVTIEGRDGKPLHLARFSRKIPRNETL